jgi:hypothetical protein
LVLAPWTNVPAASNPGPCFWQDDGSTSSGSDLSRGGFFETLQQITQTQKIANTPISRVDLHGVPTEPNLESLLRAAQATAVRVTQRRLQHNSRDITPFGVT